MFYFPKPKGYVQHLISSRLISYHCFSSVRDSIRCYHTRVRKKVSVKKCTMVKAYSSSISVGSNMKFKREKETVANVCHQMPSIYFLAICSIFALEGMTDILNDWSQKTVSFVPPPPSMFQVSWVS